MAYSSLSPADRKIMLERVGAANIEELFSDIPKALRYPACDIGEAISEMALMREMESMSRSNLDASSTAWFLGAGLYRHFIPSVVDALSSRGEFLTAYTPYQNEVSQGTLQAMFEYQSMAATLLGCEVVNASHFDGATALAEGILMAVRSPSGSGFGKKHRVLLPADCHPEYRQVIDTYLAPHPVTIVEYKGNPLAAANNLTADDACLVCMYPHFSGQIFPLEEAVAVAHSKGALVVALADPLACAVLKSPGAQGVDIVAAEGQCLGNDMNFGGPLLGMLGCTAALVRRLPGRLSGQAFDHDGRRGFALTLCAREQHIRREKAASNICTNQGLAMLRACIYMAAMGKSGMTKAARMCWDKAHYAAQAISTAPGYSVIPDTFFKEFLVATPIPAEEIFGRLAKRSVIPGLPLSRYYPERSYELLVCVTEMCTKAQIDLLVEGLTECCQ